jgi:hypothetical protein
VASRGHLNWKPQLQAKKQFSRNPPVKLIHFDGVCEIELIWAIKNIDIQIQKDGFGVSAIKYIGQLINKDNWVCFVGIENVAMQLRIAHTAIRVNNERGVNPDTPGQFFTSS